MKRARHPATLAECVMCSCRKHIAAERAVQWLQTTRLWPQQVLHNDADLDAPVTLCSLHAADSVTYGLWCIAMSGVYISCMSSWQQNNCRLCIPIMQGHLNEMHLHRQVDAMLRKFEKMNQQMEVSSSFRPAMRKEDLLQMVASNNLLFTAIISKLGVRERFDIAWKNPDCNRLYEHLLDELEIEDRYENLQLKVSAGACTVIQLQHRPSRWIVHRAIL